MFLFKKRRVSVFLGFIVSFLILITVASFLKPKLSRTKLNPLKQATNSKESNPKTVTNPITGEMYTPQEAQNWVNTRPLGVMVNNHVDARPQSGLIFADVVYEMVAEGGITRYLAFFLSHTPEKIGPVRSVREYYLILVKELGDAMIMHIGWSPQALQAIESWSVRSLGRGEGMYWRDNPNNVAIEHTAYTNGVELRKTGDELGWGGARAFDSWKFKDNTTLYQNEQNAQNISIDFWYKGDYSAIWQYDEASNDYKRFLRYNENNNPIAHIDRETKEQISVKNLIVQFSKETPILGGAKNRLDYQLIGSGNGLIFLDGKVINATWSKSERDTRTEFYDLSGNEIEFNRGKFWVSIVPDRNASQVEYK